MNPWCEFDFIVRRVRGLVCVRVLPAISPAQVVVEVG